MATLIKSHKKRHKFKGEEQFLEMGAQYFELTSISDQNPPKIYTRIQDHETHHSESNWIQQNRPSLNGYILNRETISGFLFKFQFRASKSQLIKLGFKTIFSKI